MITITIGKIVMIKYRFSINGPGNYKVCSFYIDYQHPATVNKEPNYREEFYSGANINGKPIFIVSANKPGIKIMNDHIEIYIHGYDEDHNRDVNFIVLPVKFASKFNNAIEASLRNWCNNMAPLFQK